ncbi:luciferase-like monooxygenase [Jinshanibacter sp. LJY008]|uniref:Luciferase-like monooxygenase n=1 Tax=Limnobaculum eriocheiris TaxID=2897391 RepID=A0A9X1SKY9_9GAMM|nr:luciferase-like monooxygenase [Limnobaculum eriocheiris]MCD1126185.1 luciferase-like monooxygenase [Limnobaculum eriocheiris]
MSNASSVPLSVLDLSPIVQGGTIPQAFTRSKELAILAERLGYHRYWMAEHHNMAGIASSATSVLVGYIAGATSTIRVGAGGVMLPNHSPLVIAEQFGTLASLYPNRIDLGLGRAPGTNQETAQALRRNGHDASENFPANIAELTGYFDDEKPTQTIKAIPGQGLRVPVWLLGSSLYGAQLAARMGLPYAFASHFAPDMMLQALELYRREFKPSADLKKPYAMVCVNAIAADTSAEAEYMFTSLQQHFVNMLRGTPGPLPHPVEDIHSVVAKHELYSANHTLSLSIIGDKNGVRNGLQNLLKETDADEIMINGQVFDHAARMRSFELIAEISADLAK